MWKSRKETILDLLWPKSCINCGREGKYLCDDCLALIDVSRQPPCLGFKYLDGLYFATTYDEKIVRAAIRLCKFGYIKELSYDLAYLIITHFKLLDNPPFSPPTPLAAKISSPPPPLAAATAAGGDWLLCAVPLHKSKLKQRGFNQSAEIAKHLSKSLNIPFSANALIKTKKTLPQTTLNKEKRLKNVTGAFVINPQKKDQIAGKKILLVDDVFTTGATMEECAKLLKQNCAQSVWGVVVARD
jgi:predicted amidophosphoribosyltransferase